MKTPNQYPGATFDKAAGRWKAQARVDGKLKSFGMHDTPQAAAAAVAAAKAALPGTGGLTSSEQALVVHNSKKKHVYQSNDLLEAWLKHPSKHSYYEYRLFMCMLRCLHLRDQELGAILVPVDDFMPYENLDTSYLKILKEACASMLRRQLQLPGIDGKEESFSLRTIVISLDYVHSKRAVVGAFHPDLLSHLIQLKNRFTAGDVDAVMRLRTINSQRYYWLLKNWSGQYKGNAKRVDVDELRELTSGLDKYPAFSDYRRLVMLPALEELSEHDFYVQHQEIQQGRSIVSVEFKVKLREHKEPLLPSLAEVAEKMAPALPPPAENEFDQAYYNQLPVAHKFRVYYEHLTKKLKFPHLSAKAILEFDVMPSTLMARIEKTLLTIKAQPRSTMKKYALECFRTEFPQVCEMI